MKPQKLINFIKDNCSKLYMQGFGLDYPDYNARNLYVVHLDGKRYQVVYKKSGEARFIYYKTKYFKKEILEHCGIYYTTVQDENMANFLLEIL